MTSPYRTSSLEKIEFKPVAADLGVPQIVDDWTLAFQLGTTGKRLWYVALNRGDNYTVFHQKKATGGMRTIHNPSLLMKSIGRKLRERILLPLCAQLGEHVGAYQVGRGTVDSAKMHLAPCAVCDPLDTPHTCELYVTDATATYSIAKRGEGECAACRSLPKHTCPRRGVKVSMDLKDFFPSTKRSWIRKYFHEVVGYNHFVSGMLAQLLTVDLEEGGRKWVGVPQGNPASGDICNLVANWRLDQKLIAEFPGWRYTRYADDLFFSHPENLLRADVDAMIERADAVIRESGYRLNRKKLRVQRPSRRQKVLGITVNQKVSMSRDHFRKMRSLLHNCITHGFESQTERAKKTSVGQFRGWIEGQLSYLASIDAFKTARLKLLYGVAVERHDPQPLEVPDVGGLPE